jgi:transcription initiation factor TFIIIB Brf1 subunit/transcription initiation factor TFIIB
MSHNPDPIDHKDFIDNIICTTIVKIKNDIIEALECPDCKTTQTHSDENDLMDSDGYVICSLCGLVLSSRISEMAEWANYVDSGGSMTNNSRCGSSTKTTEINPFMSDLTSFIPKGVKNVCFQDGKMVRYDISKLHIKNNFNHLQKSFNIVENQLDNITSDKYSKRICVTAKILWGEIMKAKKLTRAGVRKGLIACCLYYACIHYDCTRSPLEICQDFGMEDTKQFNKGDKEFKETFENIAKWSHLLTKTSNSEDYFSRFCSNLEMDHIIKEGVAFQLAKKCRELYESIKDDLIGLFPKSAACGIIFWVMKRDKIQVTKSKLSKSLGICSPSLTKCCATVIDILGTP